MLGGASLKSGSRSDLTEMIPTRILHFKTQSENSKLRLRRPKPQCQLSSSETIFDHLFHLLPTNLLHSDIKAERSCASFILGRKLQESQTSFCSHLLTRPDPSCDLDPSADIMQTWYL